MEIRNSTNVAMAIWKTEGQNQPTLLAALEPGTQRTITGFDLVHVAVGKVGANGGEIRIYLQNGGGPHVGNGTGGVIHDPNQGGPPFNGTIVWNGGN